MKKLYAGILIVLAVLLTGCSFKGSMAQPTDDNIKEPSELQIDVENSVSEETDIKNKADKSQQAIEDMLNNINTEATEDNQ